MADFESSTGIVVRTNASRLDSVLALIRCPAVLLRLWSNQPADRLPNNRETCTEPESDEERQRGEEMPDKLMADPRRAARGE